VKGDWCAVGVLAGYLLSAICYLLFSPGRRPGCGFPDHQARG
jgi:hypothetical protein